MPITEIFFEAGGRKDEVLNYHVDFDQRVDERSGEPVGRPTLATFNVKIIRSNEKDVPFYISWQLDPTQQESVDICFYDNNQLKRTIKVEEAFLVGYRQDNLKAGRVIETLSLSPASVDIEGTSFDRGDLE